MCVFKCHLDDPYQHHKADPLFEAIFSMPYTPTKMGITSSLSVPVFNYQDPRLASRLEEFYHNRAGLVSLVTRLRR